MTAEPVEVVDAVRVAHLAVDAAVEAARVRGARAMLASTLRPAGPDPAGWRAKSDAATAAAHRAVQAAHDAIDALGSGA